MEKMSDSYRMQQFWAIPDLYPQIHPQENGEVIVQWEEGGKVYRLKDGDEGYDEAMNLLKRAKEIK
jgi:hypothetical protein